MDKQDTKNLKKRYLLWLYKTSKEAVDRIERKFTQLEIDRLILTELKKHKGIEKFIADFTSYIQNKQKDGLAQKFEKSNLKPEYKFLSLKLAAIEKVIVKELGKSTLKEIKALYEQEITERILKSTEHK